MNRRIVCFVALVLLTGGGLRAQTLAHSPLNPRPGESVTFTLFTHSCAPLIDTAVAPPGARNVSIRFTIAGQSDCFTPPLLTYTEKVGPLQLGTYDVELSWECRSEEGACSQQAPLETFPLTVSRNGAVVGLRPEPAHPVAGQPLTVGFDTFCPLLWKEPVIQPSAIETLILLDERPEGPHPGAPCTNDPSWPVRFALDGLPAGVYRLRVRMGASPETVAESVFAVTLAGPALSLRQGRFLVRADWSAPGFGQGNAQGVPLTGESGYFTFFGATNVELIVKILNACAVNQRYWIFLAGVTDVGVTVEVEDTATGRRGIYVNLPGNAFQPVLDTSSFAVCP